MRLSRLQSWMEARKPHTRRQRMRNISSCVMKYACISENGSQFIEYSMSATGSPLAASTLDSPSFAPAQQAL